jgi:hypothetical protein
MTKESVSEQIIIEPCDSCWYLGNKEPQKVKVVEPSELRLCKPCYISLVAIERE